LSIGGAMMKKFLFEASVMELVDAGRGTVEQRELFLFNDMLLVAKPQTRAKLLAYKAHIPIDLVRLKQMPPNPALAHGVLLEHAADRSCVIMLSLRRCARVCCWCACALNVIARAQCIRSNQAP
jgi:hypothetical protein